MDRAARRASTAAAPLLAATAATTRREAIMTTDTVHKKAVARRRRAGPSAAWPRAPACSRPALATMLVVAHHRRRRRRRRARRGAARRPPRTTFDRVDSDGCMSTNDTVLLLASGASGVDPDRRRAARRGRRAVCADLARQLSPTPRARPRTSRSRSSARRREDDAVEVARAVARSNLLKCAIHGEDPNWGRVLAAVGTTDAAFEPDRARRRDQRRLGLPGRRGRRGPRQGRPVRPARCTITVDLAAGDDEATVWTNDLTADYVHENSAYST